MDDDEEIDAAALIEFLNQLSSQMMNKNLSKWGSCELCGANSQELKPYGSNGEYICYNCGMLDVAMTRRRYNQVHFKKDFDA